MSMIMAAMAGQKSEPPVFNPMTSMGWYAAYWAGDTNWTNPGNGNAVATWTDGSGNGRDLTQSTPADRPTFRSSTSVLNNKPTVEFNTQVLQCSDTIFGSLSQPDSIVMVFQSNTTDGTTDNYIDAFSGNRQIMRKRLGQYDIASGASTVPGAALDTNAHFWIGYFNTSSSVNEMDGIVQGTGSVGGQNLNGLTVGGGYNAGAASTVDFHLAFLGIASGDIRSHARWADFKAWAANEYGVTT